MSKSKFKVAVIGTGMIANAAHIPAWQDIPEDVKVVGVADNRKQAARETAGRWEIPHFYTDYQLMLDELRPDIVSVCTPNVYHKEITVAALRSGAHVLCEKPIGTSVAEAEEMYRTADEVGKQLMVSQTIRWTNNTMAAKKIAESGQLGEVYYAEASFLRRRGIPSWGFFHMKEHNAGGPAYDLGVHFVDSLMWIMGNPKPVSVSGKTYLKIGNRDEKLITSLAESGAPLGVFTPRPYDYREFDVEDFAVGFVRFENDLTMMLKTSWAINAPEDINRAFVVGTMGGLQINPPKLITNQSGYQVNVTPKVVKGRSVVFPGHYGATQHFLQVIRGEEEMLVKREEVLNVMRILDALYQSSAQNREIWLEE